MVPTRETETASGKTTMFNIFHETARQWHPTHEEFLIVLETRVYQAIQANQITIKDCVDFKVGEKLRLEEMAARDFLTGLWARAGFEERYDEVFRQSRSLTLVNLDIDHFNKVNDTFDHEKGNDVLTTLAELIKAATAKNGFGARIGGDEFVIVLPETPAENAQTVAQRIIEQFSQNLDNKILTLGVSISAGVYTSQPGDKKATILRRADRAERAAKRDGGNQVYLWRQEFDPPTPNS